MREALVSSLKDEARLDLSIPPCSLSSLAVITGSYLSWFLFTEKSTFYCVTAVSGLYEVAVNYYQSVNGMFLDE